MNKKFTQILTLSITTLCFHVNAQVTNLGIAVHPDDVSNTGTVTGSIGNSYFMWTSENGFKNIGQVTNGVSLAGNASISSDGSKIALSITNPSTNLNEITLYDVATESPNYLGGIGASSGEHTSSAFNISSDGKTIVGLGWYNEGIGHPVKWTQETGVSDMGSTQEGKSARANALSADGTVIGGWQDMSDTGYRSFAVWKNGVQKLVTEETEYGTLPLNEVAAISDNGVWATGSSMLGYAIIWSETSGVIKIDHPDVSLETGFSGATTAINADGSIAVGYFRNIFVNPAPDNGEGFIWTPTTGRVELTAYAQSLGIDTQGITFSLPRAISPDGKYIVGWGRQNGIPIGFRLQLPDVNMAVTNAGKEKVLIYPNPVKDILHIKGSNSISNVEIYDAAGKKINRVNDSRNSIDLSNLPKGAYTLKGIFNNHPQSLKFIKN